MDNNARKELYKELCENPLFRELLEYVDNGVEQTLGLLSDETINNNKRNIAVGSYNAHKDFREFIQSQDTN